LPSNERSPGPAHPTQSPEQGSGCRCLPNFLQIASFPRAQLMPCLPQSSLGIIVSLGAFRGARQQPVEQSFLILCSRAAHKPRHSPISDAARPPASALPLPPLFSSRLFHRARPTPVRDVESRRPPRQVPRYTVRS